MKRNVIIALTALALLPATALVSCEKNNDVAPATTETRAAGKDNVARKASGPWDIQNATYTQPRRGDHVVTFNVTFGGPAATGDMYTALCNSSGTIIGSWNGPYTATNGTATLQLTAGSMYATGSKMAVYFTGNYPTYTTGYTVNSTAYDHMDLATVQ